MENKLFKNMTSALLIVVMVVVGFAMPAFTGSSEVSAATYADPLKNRVIMPSSFKAMQPFKMTMIGDRQNITSAIAGDTKYVPYRWTFDGTPSGYEFGTPLQPGYVSTVKLRAGTHAFKGEFDLYEFKNGNWRDTFNNATINRTIRVPGQIKYKLNRGKTSNKSTSGYFYMTQRISNLPKVTRKGFKFLGWYEYKSGSSSSKLKSNELIGSALYFGMNPSVEVYAHWKKSVKVKFNANGGKVSKKSKKVTYTTQLSKKSYGSLPKPKKKNKYFAGWYTKKKGGTYVSKSKAVTKYKNHTLYAHWY